MNTSKIIKNPVQPSPWKSNTPRGYHYRSKKLRLSYFSGKPLFDVLNITPQDNKERINRNRNIIQESSMLKNLNRSTLVLSFPHINPVLIDAALALSDNDLSEAINLLRLRELNLKTKRMDIEQRNARRFIPTVPIASAPSKTVRYIPTKYTDVQIVEHQSSSVGNRNIRIMEVNNDVLKMLQNCSTTAIPPLTIAGPKHILPKPQAAGSVNHDSAFSESELSPTATSSSCSVMSEKLKVYDFAEDEQELYHFPKPNRKPLNKIGIVLKKEKTGLSVKLL